MVSPFLFLSISCLVLRSFTAAAEQIPPKSCPADYQPEDGRDPHLEQHPLPSEIADLSDDGSHLFYVRPDISTYYRHEGEAEVVAKKPYFNGLAGKFINMSPVAVRFYWSASANGPHHYMSDCGPFQSTGTATFPTHIFFFADARNEDDVLARFKVTAGHSVYIYDPYDGDLDRARKELNTAQFKEYKLQHDSKVFGEEYRRITGRDYLGLWPSRKRPSHKMWTADYFGQEHWVETRETHITSLPTDEAELKPIAPMSDRYGKRALEGHRDPGTLNMTMTVLSCAPRAFEIKNFLSDVEIDHILYLATGMSLGKSSTSSGTGGGKGSYDDSVSVRTSKNTWVPREKSPVVDIIYRRAADLMMIDESLMRQRDARNATANKATFGSSTSISEHLQLVHYDPGQQYTPHHDFAHPATNSEHQEQRFATLLLYLNEGMEGGETSFPRWVNAETGKPLEVVPEKGKAVLFYSILPDGNPDDLSMHAAQPVKDGEKWLTNLWVWDPVSRL